MISFLESDWKALSAMAKASVRKRLINANLCNDHFDYKEKRFYYRGPRDRVLEFKRYTSHLISIRDELTQEALENQNGRTPENRRHDN